MQILDRLSHLVHRLDHRQSLHLWILPLPFILRLPCELQKIYVDKGQIFFTYLIEGVYGLFLWAAQRNRVVFDQYEADSLFKQT